MSVNVTATAYSFPYYVRLFLHHPCLKNAGEKKKLPKEPKGPDVCVYTAGLLLYLAGLQLQEGVYSSSGSLACHSQMFLEDDLGEECPDAGYADTL